MKAVIAAYARSPFHFARKGALAQTRPDTLAAQVVQTMLHRSGLNAALIEDLILGCAYPEGPQGNNLARLVGFLAELPQQVGGMTLNRFCGSSMSAVHMAAAQIEAGMGDAFICAGVESMTMVPQGGLHFDPSPDLLARYPQAYITMGETAENVAQRYQVSRADQEVFAESSHRKATFAHEHHHLTDEIVGIRTPDGLSIEHDGCIRPQTNRDALAALKPAFRPDGVVTAGTSSPLTDGAAAVLVTSEAFARANGLQPLARIKSFATIGCDPTEMGMGPVGATRKALERAGLGVDDLDLIELNEAFSSQALACIRVLGLDDSRVNLDGGALALGHPLGATGARITGKAAALLRRTGARYALATQCIGGGQGIATVLEALS